MRLHVFITAAIDHALAIGHCDVIFVQPQLYEQIQAGYASGARAGCRKGDFSNVLADDMQCIEHGRRGDDGCAMLVVMKNRDIEAFLERRLDQECSRGLDVLEIDTAERGFQRGDNFNQFVRVLFVDLDIEDIDICKFLEQHSLAFHNGLGGQRADIAQSQYRRAVADHTHQVASGGYFADSSRILLNQFAGSRHAG